MSQHKDSLKEQLRVCLLKQQQDNSGIEQRHNFVKMS
jgi:hypothetical protein